MGGFQGLAEPPKTVYRSAHAQDVFWGDSVFTGHQILKEGPVTS